VKPKERNKMVLSGSTNETFPNNDGNPSSQPGLPPIRPSKCNGCILIPIHTPGTVILDEFSHFRNYHRKDLSGDGLQGFSKVAVYQDFASQYLVLVAGLLHSIGQYGVIMQIHWCINEANNGGVGLLTESKVP